MNWTPVEGTGLGSVTLKGVSKTAENPPGYSGNGSSEVGPMLGTVVTTSEVVAVVSPRATDDPPDDPTT